MIGAFERLQLKSPVGEAPPDDIEFLADRITNPPNGNSTPSNNWVEPSKHSLSRPGRHDLPGRGLLSARCRSAFKTIMSLRHTLSGTGPTPKNRSAWCPLSGCYGTALQPRIRPDRITRDEHTR